jgi:hypothetical protein
MSKLACDELFELRKAIEVFLGRAGKMRYPVEGCDCEYCKAIRDLEVAYKGRGERK